MSCSCHVVTEDGYTFYRLDDNSWVDNKDSEGRDMTFASLDDIVKAVDLKSYQRCDSCTQLLITDLHSSSMTR